MTFRMNDYDYGVKGEGVMCREAILNRLRAMSELPPVTGTQLARGLGYPADLQGEVSAELRSLTRSGLVERHGGQTTPTDSAAPPKGGPHRRQAKALLSNKKACPTVGDCDPISYRVTVTCSWCLDTQNHRFGGWWRLVCSCCSAAMTRTPYRKAGTP